MRKGFTLIELLAVIVILAIIALIATPIVLSIIDEVKKSAIFRSSENYITSVEQAIMKKSMSIGQSFDPRACIVQANGIMLCDGEELKLDIDGEMPSGGIVVFENGKVESSQLEYSTKIIVNSSESKNHEDIKKYQNGDIVYFDVENGKVCTEEDYDPSNSNTGYNGIDNKLETQTSCLKFYAFNDDNNYTIDLLLDHNTTARVAWSSDNNVESGPQTLLEQLYIDTHKWNGVLQPEDYEIIQGNRNYKVTYKGYKSRLIKANEIAKITGNETFKENIAVIDDGYFFSSNTNVRSDTCYYNDGNDKNISGCKYGWLYDRTAISCLNHGCLNNSNSVTYGYWTSTSVNNTTSAVWAVRFNDILYGYNAAGSTDNGVRPVIEVLKIDL